VDGKLTVVLDGKLMVVLDDKLTVVVDGKLTAATDGIVTWENLVYTKLMAPTVRSMDNLSN